MANKRKSPPTGKKRSSDGKIEASKIPANGEKAKKTKSDVRKIYKTTDGFFTGRSDIDKTRRVAAVEQRKDDGALAVVKVYSKKGKDGKAYIDKLVLLPDEHSSLTEESIVGTKLYVGVKEKTKAGERFKPIFRGDLTETDDALTKKEHKAVKRGIRNKKTVKRWKKHFKK